VNIAHPEVETTPNWALLEAKLPGELCAEFMWMYRERGIEFYKHSITRRYLLLDASGKCLARTAGGLCEIPFEDEWKRVSGRAEGDNDGSRF
jgi:hypothetical protein